MSSPAEPVLGAQSDANGSKLPEKKGKTPEKASGVAEDDEDEIMRNPSEDLRWSLCILVICVRICYDVYMSQHAERAFLSARGRRARSGIISLFFSCAGPTHRDR